ncbi:DUF4407 domain-containing protein [Dactylosporangium sp. CA-139114]|uniref:DUF4407 domain-containing protein n=1 Tax=Dactylosporangium sp. CA-139114 TaxID=3239931 RepID=UPI003D99B308
MSVRDGRSGRTGTRQRRRRRSLLLWLSGADMDTLAQAPRERRKFVGVGGIVLTTAVLACVSASFALSKGARAPLYAAIPIGLLWGLAIMNLDRWLVTATQRRPKWWQNLLTALPRILMALVIGAVISTPLVLWLFRPEIEAQLNTIHQRKLDAHQQSLLNDARFKDIPALQQRIATNQATADGRSAATDADPTVKDLQAKYDDLDKRYQAAQAEATCEFDGTCGSKSFGGGPAYQQKKAVADDLKRQRDTVGGQLEQARKNAADQQAKDAGQQRATASEEVRKDQAELDRLQKLRQSEEDQFKRDTANDTGLLAQLDALSELTGKNATLQGAYLMLLLFITTIEVLPVVVKFLINLAPPTAYDTILEKSEQADVFAAEQELARRQNLAKYAADKRQEREEELLRERIDRLDTLDSAPGFPGADMGGEATTGGWISRWFPPRQARPTGRYQPWPAAEQRTTPLRRPGGDRKEDGGEDQLTERWTYDR